MYITNNQSQKWTRHIYTEHYCSNYQDNVTQSYLKNVHFVIHTLYQVILVMSDITKSKRRVTLNLSAYNLQ